MLRPAVHHLRRKEICTGKIKNNEKSQSHHSNPSTETTNFQQEQKNAEFGRKRRAPLHQTRHRTGYTTCFLCPAIEGDASLTLEARVAGFRPAQWKASLVPSHAQCFLPTIQCWRLPSANTKASHRAPIVLPQAVGNLPPDTISRHSQSLPNRGAG